jgi:hypothetical protein
MKVSLLVDLCLLVIARKELTKALGLHTHALAGPFRCPLATYEFTPEAGSEVKELRWESDQCIMRCTY